MIFTQKVDLVINVPDFLLKFIIFSLDTICKPFEKFSAKEIQANRFIYNGLGLFVLFLFLYSTLSTFSLTITGFLLELFPDFSGVINFSSFLIKNSFLFLSFFLGGGMFFEGVKVKFFKGKSWKSIILNSEFSQPAFQDGVIFYLGDVKLSLKDLHTGIGAFGGVGTGKTVSFMVPIMNQMFSKLKDDNPNSPYAKCGALILDEKGDFIDSTVMELVRAGRDINDIIIIDPDLDLHRYNPIDPLQSAEENAEKIARVQKILGLTNSKDSYWDQTSKAMIAAFLRLLEVFKPKQKINLVDVNRFLRDESMADYLCKIVNERINKFLSEGKITNDQYGFYLDALSTVKNEWIKLNNNTKSILKTTISNMIGPLAKSPKLQNVFCKDTTFSFKDLANEGKIVLFRSGGIEKALTKLITVSLKLDFQNWMKRRNGSAAQKFGLNTSRTVIFLCDEYQEFVTCGGEGDEAFYAVSRSAKVAPIIATQSYSSLETAIGNKEQTKTLRQAISTWIFFRTTDEDTCKLGEFLAGKSKREEFSYHQDTTSFISTINPTNNKSDQGSSINVSRKVEENFRADEFTRLVTITKDKSANPPWYSEGIVYHYHSTDTESTERCIKTRFHHYYYDEETRKRAIEQVKALDYILWDRNSQRKIYYPLLLFKQSYLKNPEAEKLFKQKFLDKDTPKEEDIIFKNPKELLNKKLLTKKRNGFIELQEDRVENENKKLISRFSSLQPIMNEEIKKHFYGNNEEDNEENEEDYEEFDEDEKICDFNEEISNDDFQNEEILNFSKKYTISNLEKHSSITRKEIRTDSIIMFPKLK